jgi:hypothetical protein
MYTFIKHKTDLGIKINTACQTLFTQIQSLDVESIPFEPFYKQYFIKCHFTRPYFSLKTSAKLLYDSITATKKPVAEVVIMDYGAGLGTLYILAKMIGVKKIIYNDLLPEFAKPAIEVDKFLGYIMDEYIIGDTEETCKKLAEKNIVCDVIVSRNVVEHIYNLADYFKIIYAHQPTAILYNSTTANWNNPAAHVQHILLHQKTKPIVIKSKAAFIKKLNPLLQDAEATMLATKYVQQGGQDFLNAINEFILHKKFIQFKKDYTNICDENGTWGEHLIPYKKYKHMAPQYNIQFKPGFWDVDYKNIAKQYLGKTLNVISNLLGDFGIITASFIYIIAIPKK